MDDAPAMSELTPLAELVVERLGDAAASGGPELGVQVARFTGEKLTIFSDFYTRRDGDEVPTDEDPTVVGLIVDFRRFTDDESAEAYLATAAED